MRGLPSQGRNIQTDNRAVSYGGTMPDISMFNGVEYHFWAGSDNGVSYGSSGPFDEVLGKNSPSEATASTSNVVLKESHEGGYDMYTYPDSGGNDYHSFDVDTSLLGDKFSVFALVDFVDPPRNYPTWFSLNGEFGYCGYDDDSDGSREFGVVNFNGSTAGLIDSTTGLTALGAEPDLSGNSHKIYAEGFEASTSSTTSVSSNQTFEIGALSGNSEGWEGGVAEIIICSQHQDKSTYDTFRSDRRS